MNSKSIFVFLLTTLTGVGAGVGGTLYYNTIHTADKGPDNPTPAVPQPDAPKQSVLDAITQDLQRACEQPGSPLRGIWVAPQQVTGTGAPGPDGKLMLVGLIEEESQRTDLAREWDRLRLGIPDAERQYPGGLDVSKLTRLAMGQTLRDSRNAATVAPGRLRQAWQQTWLGTPFYSATTKRMIVPGVTLATLNPDLVASLQASISQKLNTVPEEIRPPGMPQIELSVKPNPAIALEQRLVQDATLRGVVLDNAGFDAAGKLVFTGVTHQPDQAEGVRKLIADLSARWQGEGLLTSAGWGLGEFSQFDAAMAQKSLQEKLARSGEKTNKHSPRIGLREVTVVRNPDQGLELVCSGFYLRYPSKGLATPDDPRQEITQAISSVLPEIGLDRFPLRVATGFMIKPNPIFALRERAKNDPQMKDAELDDVVVTPTGELKLIMLGEKDQRVRAEQWLKEIGDSTLPGQGGGNEVSSVPLSCDSFVNAVDQEPPPLPGNRLPRWKRTIVANLQAILAKHETVAYHGVRIDGFTHPKDPATGEEQLLFEGVWLRSTAAETVPNALYELLQRETNLQMNRMNTKEGEPVGNDYSYGIARKGIALVENPLHELRASTLVKADQKATLPGAVFEKVRYDAAGKLILLGYVTSATQLTDLSTFVSTQLKDRTQLLQPPVGVGSVDLREMVNLGMPGEGKLGLSAIRQKAQLEFSEADHPFSLTQVNELSFRYKEQADHHLSLTLHVDGAHLYQDAAIPQAMVQMKLGDRIKQLADQSLPPLREKIADLETVSLPAYSVDSSGIKWIANPLVKLQEQMQTDSQLDGVLIEKIHVNKDGRPTLQVRAEKTKVARLTEFLKAKSVEALDGLKGELLLDPDPRPFQRDNKDFTWGSFKTDVRTAMAGAKIGVLDQTVVDQIHLLQQTRIDRLFFGHDKEGRPVLHLVGVSLRGESLAVGDRPILSKFILKLLTAERIDLGVTAAREILVNQIEFRGDQLKSIRNAFEKEFGEEVALAYFHYTATGELEPRGLGFDEPGVKDRVRQFLEKALKGSGLLAPVEANTPNSNRRSAAEVLPISLDGIVYFNREAIRKQLQTDFARMNEQAVYRQTRLDQLAFIPANDRKIGIRATLVCIRTGTRNETDQIITNQLTSRLQTDLRQKFDLSRLGTEWNGDSKSIQMEVNLGTNPFRNNPIPVLHNSLTNNSLLDGVVLEGIRYDSEGYLTIDARVDSTTEQKKLLATVVAPGSQGRTHLAGVLRPDSRPSRVRETPARKEPSFQFRDQQPWKQFVNAVQAYLTQSDKAPFLASRVDRAYFHYKDDNLGQLTLQLNGITLRTDASALLQTQLSTFCPERIPDSSFKVVTDFRKVATPVVTLQNLANDRGLDDLLFNQATFDASGKLHLQILTASPTTDTGAVKQLVDGQVGQAALASILTRSSGQEPAVIDRAQPLPWLNTDAESKTLRDRLQAHFAGSDQPTVRKTRLDRAYFTYPGEFKYADEIKRTLSLQGFSLVGEIGQPRLKEELTPICGAILNTPPHILATDKLTVLENPVLAFQRMVPSDVDHDGLLFHDVHFAKTGQLILDVLLAETNPQKQFLQDILARPPVDPALFAGQSSARQHIKSNEYHFNWAEMIQQIRSQMASTESPEYLRRTWLQRAFFTRPATGVELHFQALSLAANPDWNRTAEANVKTKLAQAFDRESQIRLRVVPFKLSPKPVVNVAISERPVVSAGQARVALQRSLDGVRLSQALFTADGTVNLEGIWLGKQQSPSFAELLRLTFREQSPAFTDQRFKLDGFQSVRTDLLLQDVRRWVIANTDWEEVLVDRLYFDADGQLKLKADSPTTEADQPALRKDLNKALQAYPLGRSLMPTPSTPTPEPPPANPISIEISHHLAQPMPADPVQLGRRPGFTNFLRERVSVLRPLDGVRLDRSYFDENNVLVFTGLVGSRTQYEQLPGLIESASAMPAFAHALPNRFRFEKFVESSLQPLLETLPRVLPADPVFDGLVVNRLHHAPTGELIISGRATSLKMSEPAQQQLVRLIRLDPNGLLHLGTKPPVFKFPLIEIGLTSSGEAFDAAILAYAEERNLCKATVLLDQALFHCPTDATAWYFRALCYHLQGNDLLAERDLRRLADHVVGLGSPAPSLEDVVSARRLERIQGPARSRVSDRAVRFSLERPSLMPGDRLILLFNKLLPASPPRPIEARPESGS